MPRAEEVRVKLLESSGVIDGRGQIDRERQHRRGQQAIGGPVTLFGREHACQEHALDGAEQLNESVARPV